MCKLQAIDSEVSTKHLFKEEGYLMEITNLIIAIASLVVTAVAGIYIPLYLHNRESKKSEKDH